MNSFRFLTQEKERNKNRKDEQLKEIFFIFMLVKKKSVKDSIELTRLKKNIESRKKKGKKGEETRGEKRSRAIELIKAATKYVHSYMFI